MLRCVFCHYFHSGCIEIRFQHPPFQVRLVVISLHLLSNLRFLVKGGDPAAASATATLLRLRPSYRPRLRRLPPFQVSPPTLGVANSHDVTGGVYKARERIHRTVADARLLATPTSCRRVAAYNPN